MADKPKFNFPRVKPKETAPKEEPTQSEYITWAAVWMYPGKQEHDLPYFSVRIDKAGLEAMVEYAETQEDGVVNAMMFHNRNQRENGNDPDYYIVPPRDNR